MLGISNGKEKLGYEKIPDVQHYLSRNPGKYSFHFLKLIEETSENLDRGHPVIQERMGVNYSDSKHFMTSALLGNPKSLTQPEYFAQEITILAGDDIHIWLDSASPAMAATLQPRKAIRAWLEAITEDKVVAA